MEGINGYSGKMFRDITRGETLPFTFRFTLKDGTPRDVTGWTVYVAFNTALDSSVPIHESVFLPGDPLTGVISGFVEDDETFALAKGTYYASARYVNSDGRAFIIDMAKVKVMEGANATRRE